MSAVEQRFVFDRIADVYDRARPGYPEALVERVVQWAGLGEGASVLEIGCGTGQATRAFAARGHRVTALEPGPNLARLARENLASHPDVRIELTTFEDWEPPDSRFDLVYSAQAFHGVPRELRYRKTARLLREKGCLALCWNIPLPGTGALHEEIQQAYARHAPSLAARLPGTGRSASPVSEELAAAPEFETGAPELFAGCGPSLVEKGWRSLPS